jgi:pimeloyl-ACP methyl ester carboxylesterase
VESKIKKFIIHGLFSLVIFSAIRAKAEETYQFPFKNPLIATIMSATNSTNVPYEILNIEPRHERRNIPLLENRNTIPMSLFLQHVKAPLAFVIAGAGGNGLSGTAQLLAGELFHLGYSAITLPDPVSWGYAISRSETALPGYVAGDAKEYYVFLQEVVRFLQAKTKIQISGYSILGYSLGGLLGAYIAPIDTNQHFFNFAKYVLINPAIDTQFGLKTLDSFYSAGNIIPQSRKEIILGGIIDMLSKSVDVSRSLGKSFRQLGIGEVELKWLIGLSFRQDLEAVIFTSQQFHDAGILKNHADEYHRNARENEAFGFSFTQYLEKFVMPSLKISDPELLMRTTNLYSLASTLKTNSHIFVMANADDILIHEGDIDFLKAQLGQRLYLYPLGGHVGNLGFLKNQQDLAKIMTSPSH